MGGHVTDQANSALPSIEARLKRLKLREAGQKKFHEWKEARRHQQPSTASSPAPFDAGSNAGANQAPASKLFTFPRVPPSSAGQQQQQQQASPGTPTHSSAAPANVPAASHGTLDPCNPSNPAPSLQDAAASYRDPLVDMLLLQVESLMRDKAALQQQNVALKRENEQLQELVGYLSEQPEQASPRCEQASPRWEQHAHDEAQQPTCLEDQNNLQHDASCCHALEEDTALVSVSKRHMASSKLGSGGGYENLTGRAEDELDGDYCLVEDVHVTP